MCMYIGLNALLSYLPNITKTSGIVLQAEKQASHFYPTMKNKNIY